MKIERVLLLNPPDPSLWADGRSGYSYFEPPLGLMYVFDYLRKNTSLTVKLVDLSIEMRFEGKSSLPALLDDLLADFRPDMVAIATLYYNSLHIFHALAGMIKQRAPQAVVVMGGHYPTHMTRECLADANVDYAVLSEGELGLGGLIEALNAGRDPAQVEGLAFTRDGVLTRNARRNFWKGFAEAGRLSWEQVRFDHYFKDSRNVLHRVREAGELRIAAITASRGCPYHCAFCSSQNMWRGHWRRRRVALVIDEIRFLMDRHGVNTIVFNDENISVNRAWFLELLGELAKLGVTWISGGGLSVRSLDDPRVVDEMYRSGVGLFNLAFESTSDRTLRRIGKALTTEESARVIELVRQRGDGYVTGFFISGFPFETMADVRDNLDRAGALDIDWKCYYCFQPFPGAPLYEQCLQEGLIEAFDANYGENFHAPQLKHIDYTPQELFDENYRANLRFNFLANRNLALGSPAALEQARRDFTYVLDMAPTHVFAWLGLASIAQRQRRPDLAGQYLAKARHGLANDSFDWANYLQGFGMSLDAPAEGSGGGWADHFVAAQGHA